MPGWRDLTRTKWRLAKGDEQLDFTYRNSETPHHISDEALSELALCIYKVCQPHSQTVPYRSRHSDLAWHNSAWSTWLAAGGTSFSAGQRLLQARRLPVETLTGVVRAAFEPNEYPASMARLVAWTPDEAIPEFYDDPDVFESIHESMPALAVPGWASSNADFVRRHRHAPLNDLG